MKMVWEFLGFFRRTGEGLLAASDDNGSNGIVGLEREERLIHLAHQFIIQSIQGLGTVQCDDSDVALLLGENVGESDATTRGRRFGWRKKKWTDTLDVHLDAFGMQFRMSYIVKLICVEKWNHWMAVEARKRQNTM
jgi:hypothetical protein